MSTYIYLNESELVQAKIQVINDKLSINELKMLSINKLKFEIEKSLSIQQTHKKKLILQLPPTDDNEEDATNLSIQLTSDDIKLMKLSEYNKMDHNNNETDDVQSIFLVDLQETNYSNNNQFALNNVFGKIVLIYVIISCFLVSITNGACGDNVADGCTECTVLGEASCTAFDCDNGSCSGGDHNVGCYWNDKGHVGQGRCIPICDCPTCPSECIPDPVHAEHGIGLACTCNVNGGGETGPDCCGMDITHGFLFPGACNYQGQVCSVANAPTTSNPTYNPTPFPTSPTSHPTSQPSNIPTKIPTHIPSYNPTKMPSYNPTTQPSNIPSKIPTYNPTTIPTNYPTNYPTIYPTIYPTNISTNIPTNYPTYNPTNSPSYDPTSNPIYDSTADPTADPTDSSDSRDSSEKKKKKSESTSPTTATNPTNHITTSVPSTSPTTATNHTTTPQTTTAGPTTININSDSDSSDESSDESTTANPTPITDDLLLMSQKTELFDKHMSHHISVNLGLSRRSIFIVCGLFAVFIIVNSVIFCYYNSDL